MQKNSAADNNRKTVEAYIPMVKFIAAVCGPRCEVALHDLDDVDHSIVAIENGHITGRKVGDGLVDFALGSVFDLNNRMIYRADGDPRAAPFVADSRLAALVNES